MQRGQTTWKAMAFDSLGKEGPWHSGQGIVLSLPNLKPIIFAINVLAQQTQINNDMGTLI